MAEQNNQVLKQAEQLLREGNKQDARAVLVGYVRNNPSSTRGWWMLSFALTDSRQQIECVERVLRLDPNYAPAHARLLKLKKDYASQPSFEQLSAKKEGALPSHVISPVPLKTNSAPQPIRARKQVPAKKKMKWMLPFAMISTFVCAIIVIIIGFVVVLKNQTQPVNYYDPQMPLTSPAIVHEQTLPPTWTPAVAPATPTPSLTVVPVETMISTSDTMTPQNSVIVPQSRYGLSVGKDAPGFTLKNVVTGKQESLSDYLGHPVILFFFIAETCDYCDFEADHLQDIYTTYQSEGLVILGIVSGGSPYGEDGISQEARSYAELHGLTFRILNDWQWKVFDLYKVDGFPVNYFVDKNGIITSYYRGSMDYSMINLKVRIMLELIPTPLP